MVVFNYYYYLLTHMPTLLLLLLSRFSRVRLCATPWTAAHQASPSMILQARTLERVAISFSNAWKCKVKVKSLSRVRLLATPWTAAHQAPPSMGFSGQQYWSGVPLPSPMHRPLTLIYHLVSFIDPKDTSENLYFSLWFCKKQCGWDDDDSDEDDDSNDDKIYYVSNAFCVPDRVLRGLHILSLTFTHKEGTIIAAWVNRGIER